MNLFGRREKAHYKIFFLSMSCSVFIDEAKHWRVGKIEDKVGWLYEVCFVILSFFPNARIRIVCSMYGFSNQLSRKLGRFRTFQNSHRGLSCHRSQETDVCFCLQIRFSCLFILSQRINNFFHTDQTVFVNKNSTFSAVAGFARVSSVFNRIWKYLLKRRSRNETFLRRNSNLQSLKNARHSWRNIYPATFVLFLKHPRVCSRHFELIKVTYRIFFCFIRFCRFISSNTNIMGMYKVGWKVLLGLERNITKYVFGTRAM